jgi:hypothetical protein
MDGSVVGRGCLALMLHVVYKGRALPLAWRVRQSPTGHCPEALHIEVVELISQLIPEGTKVVFLGDGAFDGTDLQRTLHEMGWSYVCRTAMSTTATWNGQTFRLDTLGACLKPGRLIELKAVHFTRDAYGPIMVLCGWAKGRVSKNAILKPRSLTGFWIQDVKAVSLLPSGSAFSRKCSLPGLGTGGPWHSS